MQGWPSWLLLSVSFCMWDALGCFKLRFDRCVEDELSAVWTAKSESVLVAGSICGDKRFRWFSLWFQFQVDVCINIFFSLAQIQVVAVVDALNVRRHLERAREVSLHSMWVSCPTNPKHDRTIVFSSCVCSFSFLLQYSRRHEEVSQITR